MTAVDAIVLWTLEDWADAVVRLPVEGVLPRRTVLVPNERVAHALRRVLVERGERASLVGTRFLSLLQLAREILRNAGESLVATDSEVARLLTRRAIAASPFESLRADEMLSTSGWDEAIARTLAELEAAELEPAALLSSGERHVRDVGRVFEAVASSRKLVTPATILRRAADLCSSFDLGPLLATVTGFESAAEARLLNALPNVQKVRWGVRPSWPQHEERFRALFGHGARWDLSSTAWRTEPETQLEALQVNLFTDRSSGMSQDGTVRVVTYAGVHEEVEAAVGWVVEQIMAGVDAQDLAILAPSIEVYGPLLRARLSSLPWPGEGMTVHTELGVPVVERGDGQRVLAVLRALLDGLSRAALAALLPLLRPRDTEALGIRGVSRAWALINAVAHVGGERSHLEGGLVWKEAWEGAVSRLEQASVTAGGLEERETAHRDGLRADLQQLLPAIAALTQVLGRVVAGAPLADIRAALADFVQGYLKLPPSTPPAWAVLAAASDVFDTDDACAPSGRAAVVWLERVLLELTVRDGRFGEPRVYVGTLAGVRGLSFRAVRLMGLTEGAVPSAAREDPVLPDAARSSLSSLLLTSRQRAHRQVAAFDDAVRCARETLVLSAPRVSAERSTRQPAAALLDVVRALGRAGSRQGLERELEAVAREGRAQERELRQLLAVSASARLDRIARGDLELPTSADTVATSLSQLRAIRERADPGAQDGLLANVFAAPDLPGLTPERPISASRLQTLLSCPHQYLYEHLLGLREPETPLPSDVLPANIFGTWLHDIAETFWREHGPAIAARQGDLEQYRDALRTLATARFRALREGYPFANDMVASAERDALCDQLDKLLLHDWNDGAARAFVDVERAFGYAEPCALSTAAGPLFVRGKIDKLDSEAGTLLVRDIKTGAGKPRRAEAAPELGIDLQLGVYAQVAQTLARSWGTPQRVEVAYLYLRRGELERSWQGDDYGLLAQATKEWLATAAETLKAAAFVRTLNRDDCRFCPHQAVCASDLERAEGALEHPQVPGRLANLKRDGEAS